MGGLESASPTELAVLTPSDGAPAGAAGADKPFSLFGEDGFTFADFIDIINPLQHIPLLSTLYRHLTGDTIDSGSRVLGGTLFGGPIGTVASLINVFVEENTGKDLGEHAVALFTDETPVSETAVAQGGASEARFETAAGGAGGGVREPLASSTDAIVATVQANRFAVATVAPAGVAGAPPAFGIRGHPVSPGVAGAPPAFGIRGHPVSPGRSEPLAPALALGPARIQAASAATRQVASATTQLRRGGHQADAFSTLRYRAALRVADDDKDRESKAPVAGATAAQGGWFTDAMLSGLVKYDAAVQQTKPTPGHAVDLSN